MTETIRAHDRICSRCNKVQSVTAFQKRLPHMALRGRLYFVRPQELCFPCRKKIYDDRRDAKVWTWANAVHKGTSMSVFHAGETWDKALTPEVILALWLLQNGFCPVLHTEMWLPPQATIKPQSTLRKDGKLPALVRVTKAGGWTPGNVMLVASVAVPLIELFDGVSGFYQHIRQQILTPFTVYSTDLLRGVILKQVPNYKKELINESVET